MNFKMHLGFEHLADYKSESRILSKQIKRLVWVITCFCLIFTSVVGSGVLVKRPEWIGAEWPQLLPARVLDSALAVWAGLLFFCVLATFEEWLWHRKVSRYIDEQQTQHKPG